MATDELSLRSASFSICRLAFEWGRAAGQWLQAGKPASATTRWGLSPWTTPPFNVSVSWTASTTCKQRV